MTTHYVLNQIEIDVKTGKIGKHLQYLLLIKIIRYKGDVTLLHKLHAGSLMLPHKGESVYCNGLSPL